MGDDEDRTRTGHGDNDNDNDNDRRRGRRWAKAGAVQRKSRPIWSFPTNRRNFRRAELGRGRLLADGEALQQRLRGQLHEAKGELRGQQRRREIPGEHRRAPVVQSAVGIRK
jgi:hypothetical protein